MAAHPELFVMTLAQTIALYRKWNQQKLYLSSDGMPKATTETQQDQQRYMTFPEFCELAQVGTDGCIMVPWCGMWLGIEKDGYTHS